MATAPEQTKAGQAHNDHRRNGAHLDTPDELEREQFSISDLTSDLVDLRNLGESLMRSR